MIAGLAFQSLVLVSLLALVILFGCLIYSIVVVGKTSATHGQSTALWILIVLLFGPIGFSIYLFVIQKTKQAILWLLFPPALVVSLLILARIITLNAPQ